MVLVLFYLCRNALGMWRHLQDIQGSHGLKYKWAGSHSNRILLDCLGIRNIVSFSKYIPHRQAVLLITAGSSLM